MTVVSNLHGFSEKPNSVQTSRWLVRLPARTMQTFVRRYLLIMVILGIWELAVRTGTLSSLFLPSPSHILTRLFDIVFVSREVWRHLAASLQRLACGLAIATVVGGLLGIFMGSITRVSELFETLVELLRPIPAIALIPFALFYFGIGDASKIFLIAFGATFPLLLNTMAGMRSTDRVLINAGLVLGASSFDVITRIKLPAALPFILTGFRISVGLGLVVLVAAEMVAAVSGLGFYILNSEMTWKIEDMFSGILLLSFIGVSVNWLLLRVEARVMRWR
jgi:NitT/TauT family transport system permease protein